MAYDHSNSEFDVFRRLKPVFGDVVDEWWIAYNSDTPKGKAQLLQDLNLLAIMVQEQRVGDRRIYLEPPREEISSGGAYTIGSVVYPGISPYPFTLHRNELLRHVFMVGPSGTGKTTLIIGLLRQLLGDGVPFCCIDWKRNYRCLTKDPAGQDVIVLTVGTDLAPLRLNMLQPPSGVSTYEWIEALADAICAGYFLSYGARSRLTKALRSAVSAHGERATLRDAFGYLRLDLASATRSRKFNWLESTERAFEELTTGPYGDCLNESDHPTTIQELLSRPVVFELEGLGQDQKKMFCVYLLQAVLLTRKKQTLPREILHHALIFDEAHNVFPKEKLGDPPLVQSLLAREVREYGEAIIAATQQTDISNSIIANSGTKIFLRMDFNYDMRMVSEMLNIEPWLLTKIPDGHGIARLPGRYLQPFLFSFPVQPLKNIKDTDDTVRSRYEEWRTGKPLSITSTINAQLRGKALDLLNDIAQYPLRTIMQHYNALQWNAKLANRIKDSILKAGLATITIVENKQAHMKFLSLTPTGVAIIKEQGLTITPTGQGGIEHEYWRQQLKNICEQNGYTVTTEHTLKDNTRVDLKATNTTHTYLIEIETGHSNIAANITKCHGQPLIMFFTNNNSYKKHQHLIPSNSNIITLTPNTLHQLPTILNTNTLNP